jgi:hypothetical protein
MDRAHRRRRLYRLGRVDVVIFEAVMSRLLGATNSRVRLNVIATDFSLTPDVSFWGEAEVGRAAEPCASVENDPERTPGVAFASLFCSGRK